MFIVLLFIKHEKSHGVEYFMYHEHQHPLIFLITQTKKIFIYLLAVVCVSYSQLVIDVDSENKYVFAARCFFSPSEILNTLHI